MMEGRDPRMPENVSCETFSAEIAASKKELRKKMLKLRQKALNLTNGRAAQERLLKTALWREAEQVALYASLPDEAPTSLLLEAAWDSGKIVWLPRIADLKAGAMRFYPCAGMEELRPGPLGILEPPEVSPGGFRPDLILVPGLAFDRSGRRLGYGGGFYDRFLADGRQCPAVGFCLDVQVLECVPHARQDMPVNILCTDREWLCL